MSMSQSLIMRDPSIFPDLTGFRPERWLEYPNLERYRFAFSRGTRGCIDIALAWTEMRLILADVSTMYEVHGATEKWDKGMFELYDTDDGGLVLEKDGSQGIIVKIRSLPTKQG